MKESLHATSLCLVLFVLYSDVHAYQLVGMRSGMITMRKQKASDKRTRRMQRGDASSFLTQSSSSTFVASTLEGGIVKSPTTGAEWKQKRVSFNAKSVKGGKTRGGRGRSQKRSYTYAALSAYHSVFCELLGEEFKAEVSTHVSSRSV